MPVGTPVDVSSWPILLQKSVLRTYCPSRRSFEAEARPLLPPAQVERQPDALELTLATQLRRYELNATLTQRTRSVYSAAVEPPVLRVYANSARWLPA